MKSAIICGSHRKNSGSLKVSQYLQEELTRQGQTSWLLDLAEANLPMWDESVWANAPLWEKTWKPLEAHIETCDAVIVVAPEWGGMVPPALKNFFLLASGGTSLAHKPGLIVSVSAGISGAYPIAELRMSSYKNTKICYIPDHIIVRQVEGVLNADQAKVELHDEQTRARISYSVSLLKVYSDALAGVRASGVPNYKEFRFGM